MAARLTDIFPDPDVLTQLAPEDLAPVLLRLARDALQNGKIHPQAIFEQVHGPLHDHSKGYPQNKKHAAELALNSAWEWLKRSGLVVPEPGINGQNGWHLLSPQGAKIASEKDFESFKQAAEFPRALLHPSIADAVWLDLARGEFDTAVFKALRAVEESVRAAGKFTSNDYGVDLMRKAFSPNSGPMRDGNELPSEREALASMFAGVLGYYKNPQSHRTVGVSPAAAREIVVLASHLLRIVDERRPKVGP